MFDDQRQAVQRSRDGFFAAQFVDPVFGQDDPDDATAFRVSRSEEHFLDGLVV